MVLPNKAQKNCFELKENFSGDRVKSKKCGICLEKPYLHTSLKDALG